MTTRKSSSRVWVPTPIANGEAANKQFAEQISTLAIRASLDVDKCPYLIAAQGVNGRTTTIMLDTDGVPYLESVYAVAVDDDGTPYLDYSGTAIDTFTLAYDDDGTPCLRG